MKEEPLNSIRSRPRFKMITSLTPGEFTQRLKSNMEKDTERFEGKVSLQESFIEVKTLETPVWKPRLTLRAEVDPEEKVTEVRGIFGPRPSVWTLFMFFYIILGTMFMVFACLYYSMYLVHNMQDSDFYWAGSATIICLLVLIITYILAKIGHMKSKKEIKMLREFAESVVLPYAKKKRLIFN